MLVGGTLLIPFSQMGSPNFMGRVVGGVVGGSDKSPACWLTIHRFKEVLKLI